MPTECGEEAKDALKKNERMWRPEKTLAKEERRERREGKAKRRLENRGTKSILAFYADSDRKVFRESILSYSLCQQEQGV